MTRIDNSAARKLIYGDPSSGDLDAASAVLERFAIRRGAESRDASDVVVEALIRARGAVANGAVVESPRSYLFQVVGNVVTDGLRRAQRKPEVPLDTAFGRPAEDVPDLEGVFLTQVFSKLQKVLKPMEVALLYLRVVEERSWSEIVEHINFYRSSEITESALRARFSRITKRLRESMGDTLVAGTDIGPKDDLSTFYIKRSRSQSS